MDCQVAVQKKSKGHKCYLCGQRFATIHLVRKHVNIHKDKDLECDYCGKFFSSNWGLSKHVKIHTGELPYSCKYCHHAFRQNGELKNHIAKIHENTLPYNYCQSCGKRLKNLKTEQFCWLCSYKNEASNTCDLPTFDISNYTITSIGEAGLAKETNKDDGSVDNPNVIELPATSIAISNVDPLQQNIHIISEADTPQETQKAVCSSCMMPFSNLVTLREHVAKMHKPNWQFACSMCKATFVTPGALEKHVETHKENRPFTCLICNSTFKNQIGLKTHLATHRSDRPFKCPNCDTSFKTMLSLKAHAIVHQQERPYTCRQCGFNFKAIHHLKKHMIVHSSEKPHKCNKCGKLFRHPSNLGRHYNLHNAPKQNFKCNMCGKNFPQSAGLKQHEQNVHNKIPEVEKTYICPICEKGFKLMSRLRQHFVIHRKEIQKYLKVKEI